YHVTITNTIDGNRISRSILKEVRPNYSSNLKSAPNSDSWWMHGKLLDHLWIFSPPNSTVLFIHVPIKLKMRLIAEDDFLRKITIDLLMLQYPIGECTALRMVCWLQFLCQLDLVST
ncbi:hypothetical protein ALC56_03595, partial [Trachymyrmex septentrionalis]